jgi:hypothetical protein
MMRWLTGATIYLVVILANAQENVNPYDVQVSVTAIGDRFNIMASYQVPIDICTAYAFITDYEGAKQIPGIVESRVLSRAQNKVRVQRLIKEQILFYTVEMKSIVEYTEVPNTLVTFEQLSGDNKEYRGSWKLSEIKDKTLFRYEAMVEPHSIIPSIVIGYFVKNSIRARFESMAQRAAQTPSFDCN